jgi:hypothetical protein
MINPLEYPTLIKYTANVLSFYELENKTRIYFEFNDTPTNFISGQEFIIKLDSLFYKAVFGITTDLTLTNNTYIDIDASIVSISVMEFMIFDTFRIDANNQLVTLNDIINKLNAKELSVVVESNGNISIGSSGSSGLISASDKLKLNQTNLLVSSETTEILLATNFTQIARFEVFNTKKTNFVQIIIDDNVLAFDINHIKIEDTIYFLIQNKSIILSPENQLPLFKISEVNETRLVNELEVTKTFIVVEASYFEDDKEIKLIIGIDDIQTYNNKDFFNFPQVDTVTTELKSFKLNQNVSQIFKNSVQNFDTVLLTNKLITTNIGGLSVGNYLNAGTTFEQFIDNLIPNNVIHPTVIEQKLTTVLPFGQGDSSPYPEQTFNIDGKEYLGFQIGTNFELSDIVLNFDYGKIKGGIVDGLWDKNVEVPLFNVSDGVSIPYGSYFIEYTTIHGETYAHEIDGFSFNESDGPNFNVLTIPNLYVNLNPHTFGVDSDDLLGIGKARIYFALNMHSVNTSKSSNSSTFTPNNSIQNVEFTLMDIFMYQPVIHKTGSHLSFNGNWPIETDENGFIIHPSVNIYDINLGFQKIISPDIKRNGEFEIDVNMGPTNDILIILLPSNLFISSVRSANTGFLLTNCFVDGGIYDDSWLIEYQEYRFYYFKPAGVFGQNDKYIFKL